MSRVSNTFSFSPASGVSEVDSLKKTVLTTEEASLIGGKTNGRSSNSQLKALFSTTTLISNRIVLKSGSNFRPKISQNRLTLLSQFRTSPFQLQIPFQLLS